MWYLLIIPILYALLVFFLPKGSRLQEALYLPVYWFRTIGVSTKGIITHKYKYGKHRRQYILAYKSAKTAIQRKHVIVYYHGGGWRFGSPEMFKSNAKPFTDLGYTVIMPSYRRTPRYDYYAIREDISTSIQFIYELLQQKHNPNTTVILGGMSAGAHLAASLLYDRKELEKLDIPRYLFRGIFLCGAPLDLSKMSDSFILENFAGKRDSAQFEAANPVTHLAERENTSLLCFHGTKDGFVEYEAAESFIHKLKKVQQTDVAFHTIDGGSHLDAGSWAFRDDEVKQHLMKWLSELE